MSPSDDLHAVVPDTPELPPRGERAFLEDSEAEMLSRSAQLLCGGGISTTIRLGSRDGVNKVPDMG